MYEKLNVKARGLMIVCEIIACIVATAVIFSVWLIIKDYNMPFSANLIWIIAVIIWALGITAPFVRYERYRYRFTDEEIDVKEGFIFITRDVVPIERLHKIAMQSGPLDRMFGLSKVIVTTAGGDVTIRFMENKKAEEIVDTLKKRINSYAVKSRMED
mgnify:CR=1 FL=1